MKLHPAILTALSNCRAARVVGACALLQIRALAIGAVAGLFLAACSSSPPAPVVDMSTTAEPATDDAAARKAASAGATYRVVRGDTLYAIAFRNGVDYRELASWNGIEPPYRIYVGQELRLGPPGGETSKVATTVAAAPARTPATSAPRSAAPAENDKPVASSGAMFEDVPATTPLPAPAQASVPAPASHPASTDAPPQAAAPPLVASTPPKTAVAESPVKPAPPPKASEEGAVNGAGGLNWRWPGKGPLIGNFVAGDQTRQGIDIGGTAGDPVLAAADGEVVYSGNGLLGYGELIIVKHNTSFLSAYGHNRKRLVQEGERIKSGQQIAEMGSSASARDELHFEIRKNGKPVNPLDYLPSR